MIYPHVIIAPRIITMSMPCDRYRPTLGTTRREFLWYTAQTPLYYRRTRLIVASVWLILFMFLVHGCIK